MKRVLITRPFSTAKLLAEKIKLLGLEPIIFPAIEIKPLNNFITIDADIIIFISPTAVDYVKNISPSAQLFAVGKDTASKINREVFYPEKAGSEELLRLNLLQNIKNKKVIIYQGKGGNNLIFDILTERGAKVNQIFLYERVLPTPQNLPDLSSIDLIIATSGESIKNLILLLGEKIFEKELLVSSERLKSLAQSLGFKSTIKLAKQATDEAILQALQTISLKE